MKTSEKIIKYLHDKGSVSPRELTSQLNLTDRAIRKQLNSLLKRGIVNKIGIPPKVFYYPSLFSYYIKSDDDLSIAFSNTKNGKEIAKSYLYISPSGQMISGTAGFVGWCLKQKLPLEKTANEYVRTLAKYAGYKKAGFIDGLPKFKQTFPKVWLDKVFYLDFYSIERFGKTKLGQMLLYAKQSQNKELISSLVEEIRPKVMQLVSKYRIDGVVFVPPTVKREVQFMKILEQQLHLKIRSVVVTKVKTQIIIPQKTLTKPADRIENAERTFVVEERNTFNNILIIDDAVGSGATLNEIAKKIRIREICKGKIIGLSVTGSYKGFDVISEV